MRLLSVSAAIAMTAAARGETLYFSDGTSLPNCTIQRYDGDRLLYRAPTGPDVARPAAEVVRIEMPSAPAFSIAEQALAEGRPDDAVDAYTRTLRTLDDPAWLRQREALRLLQAAGATRRFDVAVDALIALARVNPQAAQDIHPVLPDRRSSFLDTALGRLAAALKDPALTGAQRQPLLLVQLDIAEVRRDVPLTIRSIEHLLRLSNPPDRARAAAASIVADRLHSAEELLSRSQAQAAAAQIAPIAAIILDPDQQARALYLRAQCAAAAARDADALTTAAVAYLRVPAHFPSSPLAADAVANAASLLQSAGDASGAARLGASAPRPSSP